MEFTPRLVQILFLLLKSSKPIKAAELAEQLHISKRTVFRELEHVNNQLEKYEVHLENKIRQGFLITGKGESKQSLLELLESTDSFDPRNREERQKKLILALLQEEQMQKIYYYADLLQVSEATISNDLEAIDEWFIRNQIKLERRAGFGIFLTYEERNYRNAILSYISSYGEVEGVESEGSIIAQDAKEAIDVMLQQTRIDLTGKLTKSSYDSLVLYLAISVERIMKRKVIYLEQPERNMEIEAKAYAFVEEIAAKLATMFPILFNEDEKLSLYIFLKSRKIKYIQKGTALLKEKGLNLDLRNMIYEMINAYDVTMAYELKQDENLIEGLLSHLRPTVTRIIHNIPIQNTLLPDIKANYKEVYDKSKNAAKVMEKSLGSHISSNEIGYLTLHFGGAQARIEQERRKRRKVDIGVACASGIGISSLLSSRLIHFFEEKIRITVLTADKIQKGDYENVDLIVSTIELHEFEIPFIQVEPMITASQLQKISQMVEEFSHQEKKVLTKAKQHLEMVEIMHITNEIYSILADFHVYHVASKISYEEVLHYGGKLLSDTKEKAQQIYDDISKREALSTQVIPEYELALFHAKTSAVENSKFIVILPEEDKFTDSYFQDIKMILIMLIPINDPRETLAISSITNSLFTNDDFCELLKSGNEEKIQREIEQYLNMYLSSCIAELYQKSRK